MPDTTRWSGGDVQEGTCQMPSFSFVLLYVENPPASAAFYADLLGRPAIDTSPTFAMLPLSDGVMLALWSRKTVEPAAVAPTGAGQIEFPVATAPAVQARLAPLT